MKKKITALLLISFLLTACTRPVERPMETNLSSIYGMADIQNCKITSDEASVKSGIGNDFQTIATLRKDDIVKVLEQVGDRYVIQLGTNQVGSIDTGDATPIVKEGDDQRTPQATVQPDQTQQPNMAQQPEIPQTNQDVERTETGQVPQQNVENRDNQLVDDTQRTRGVGDADVTETPAPYGATGNTTQTPATETTTALSSQERRMVELINEERAKNNLPALSMENEVTRVARIKSQDMVDNNYFSHYSPTYGSPFEMMTSFGVKYLHAGENLAGNSSVERAHEALMNSSGHRKNILSPDFTHVGIGVRSSDRYGFVYTQMFISKPQ